MNSESFFTEKQLQEFRVQLGAQNTKQRSKLANLAIILLSIGAFFATGLLSTQPLDVIILISVLLFHELGHLIAMRIFGYQDLKVFFIPFFGAVAMGKKTDASPLQKSIVSLMGSLPGILLAIMLHEFYQEKNQATVYFVNLMLIINTLNLLPLTPLDGGRLLEELFPKNMAIGIFFISLSTFGLILIAYNLKFWGLCIFSAMPLIIFHRDAQYDKVLRMQELRDSQPKSVEDILSLPNPILDRILLSLRKSFFRIFEPKIRYKIIILHLQNMIAKMQEPKEKHPWPILTLTIYLVTICTAIYFINERLPVVFHG